MRELHDRRADAQQVRLISWSAAHAAAVAVNRHLAFARCARLGTRATGALGLPVLTRSTVRIGALLHTEEVGSSSLLPPTTSFSDRRRPVARRRTVQTAGRDRLSRGELPGTLRVMARRAVAKAPGVDVPVPGYRVDALDGLRGCLALIVALTH